MEMHIKSVKNDKLFWRGKISTDKDKESINFTYAEEDFSINT